MTNPNNDMLDDLFAQARKAEPVPSEDLVARVLADAAERQHALNETTGPAPGLWARVLDAIGGWPAVSGLAAATVAGIWVGVAPPSSVEDMTASLVGDEVSINLFSTDLMFEAGAIGDG